MYYWLVLIINEWRSSTLRKSNMSIFNSAYATHGTTGYVLGKLQSALETNYYHGNLTQYKENVYAVTLPSADVPMFNYPCILKLKDTDIVVFDARNITSYDRSGNFNIRDNVQYQARAITAQLALDWHQGFQTRVRDISPIGLVVYSNWLSEVIAKRFALDARAQLQVAVLAGIFYINNFWDKSEADKEDIGYLVSALTRICGYRNSDVIDIVETHPIIKDVTDFCECVKEFTQNVRLEELNPATLFGVVRGSWFASAGGEAVAIALEYPPLWLGMLFQAITDRGYKKSGLAQIAERNSYRKYHDEFIRTLAYLGAPDNSY